MKSSSLLIASFFALATALACSDEGSNENPGGDGDGGSTGPAAGSEGGPCLVDDSCDKDLSCASNLCVQLDDSMTGLGGSTAGAMGGASGGSDGSEGGDDKNTGGGSSEIETGTGGTTEEPCEEGARDCVDVENGSEVLACEGGVWIKGARNYTSCPGPDGKCVNDDSVCVVDTPSFLLRCIDGEWVESGCDQCSADGKTCDE